MTLRKQLTNLVVDWEITHRPKEFPLFDRHVSDSPHTLVFLQDPGPSEDAGDWASIQNNDPTAKELKRLALTVYREAELQHILVWNTIPWKRKRGTIKSEELGEAKPLHAELINLLRPSLKRIILMGRESHRLLPYFSGLDHSIDSFGGHHTGRLARKDPSTVLENEALFLTLGRLQ
jgi:uracil-DNA glycosylase